MRNHTYLGLVIDDCLSWRPAVKQTISRCALHLNVLRRIRGQTWGTSQSMTLQMYRGLIQSRLLYALPLVLVRDAQVTKMKALRICLGLPLSVPNEKSSVGTLDDDPPPPPPHATVSLNISEEIPQLRSKKLVSDVVSRNLAEEHVDSFFDGWIKVFTDGSVCHQKKSSTAAVIIPELAIIKSGRLNFHTSSTIEELKALELALDTLHDLQSPERAALLTDSRAALQILSNLEDAPPIARIIASKVESLEKKGWTIAFQWLPSHCGIDGNERADRIAAEAHERTSSTLHVPKINEARLLIARETQKRHPDLGDIRAPPLNPPLAGGTPPPPVPTKLGRPEAALLHRLRTRSAFTASWLYRIKRVDSPHCQTCQVPEDIEHLLRDCPIFDAQRSRLHLELRQIGAARQSLSHLLFPPGPRGIATKCLVFLPVSSMTGPAWRKACDCDG
ncbi:hypothetical protein HPB47_007189 [Ixodes persulcatus]|uniref:Uncharacterized protein n=1 Tax=Ixodes persulcatus TaxID=34615 RepID=A0AC60P7Y4_IXOPE|nr:hypothetical protein HPB47_007189 [Ixodes persulcatus]